jgi:hypothetical protein
MKTGNDLLGTISVVFISIFIFSACLFMTYKHDHMDLYDDTFPYYIPSVDVRVKRWGNMDKVIPVWVFTTQRSFHVMSLLPLLIGYCQAIICLKCIIRNIMILCYILTSASFKVFIKIFSGFGVELLIPVQFMLFQLNYWSYFFSANSYSPIVVEGLYNCIYNIGWT